MKSEILQAISVENDSTLSDAQASKDIDDLGMEIGLTGSELLTLSDWFEDRLELTGIEESEEKILDKMAEIKEERLNK